MNATTQLAERVAPPKPAEHSLIRKIAAKYSIDPEKMLRTLKDTAFRQPPDRAGNIAEVTNEQMLALLVVADQYGLNPFTRELYAFPAKGGGIVPIVSIDGWIRIVNEHEQFNGVEFAYGYSETKALEWIEAIMYRRDREHPTRIRELLVECKRGTEPWNTMPSRMLRNRTYVQCARVAFGFAGIFDPEEGLAVLEGESKRVPDASPDQIARINAELGKPPKAAAEAPKPAATVEVAATAPKSEPEAGERPAIDAEPPAPAFVRSLIAKAASLDALDEARDLIRFVLAEASRAELDVEERAKRKQLAPA